MKKTAILPLALAGALASCSQQDQQPNVIILMGDDVGFGDLSFNGTSAVQTPNVDRLCSEGINFTNAHATAATSTPSRYSLLTGEYAWRKPGTGIAAGNAGMIIRPERYTIADMFKSAGYTTAAIGKWHLGLGDKTGEQDWNTTVSPNPSDIGFDYSYIMAATADRTPCIWIKNGLGVNLDPDDPIEVSYTEPFPGEPTGESNPELLRLKTTQGHLQSIINGISRIGYMKGGKKALWRDEDIADTITVQGLEFIRKCAGEGKPFFLYLATNDVHVPRVPHERFQGKSGLGARGDAILSFDYTVGAVMDELDRLGIAKNTLIILSSDNGGVLDDGYADDAIELAQKAGHKHNGIYRAGKYSIYEGGTRIPFIVRWKGKVKPGASDKLLSQIDIFASLASLVGGEIPEGAAPDSRNYMQSMLDTDTPGRDYAVEQNLQNNLAVLHENWKCIPAAPGPAIEFWTKTELGNNPDEAQLYDLASDPSEQTNLAAKNPTLVQQMGDKLDEIIAAGGKVN